MATKQLSWEEQRKAYEQRSPLYWADMQVGQGFEPVVFSITKEVLDTLAKVTGDDNPAYTRGQPKAIAPQSATVIFSRLAYLGDKYRPAPGGIVASLGYQFIKPVKVGDVITSKAKVTGKEERKGRKFFTIRAESVNQSGELVSVMEQTAILPR